MGYMRMIPNLFPFEDCRIYDEETIMDNKASFEIRQVVRRYSQIVAEKRPDDTLSQALGSSLHSHEEDSQSRRWTDKWDLSRVPLDDEKSTLLDKQYEKTKDVLVQFHRHLNPGTSTPTIRSQTTIQELIQDVDEAMMACAKRHESGFGKARDRARNFLITLNEYKFLFDIVPNGDRYTSLMTGAISAVVKASVNHKRIADGFSAYLAEISQDMQAVYKSIRVADTTTMRELVVDLFTRMFDFLCDAMQWYQNPRRRLRDAFKFNSEPKVSERISAIRAVLGRIRHEAEQVTQTRIKAIHDMQSLKMDMKIAADESRASQNVNEQIEKLSAEFVTHLRNLGYKAENLLAATGEHTIYDRKRTSRSSKTETIEYEVQTSANEESDNEPRQENEAGPRTYTRYELEEQAGCLDKYLEDMTMKATSKKLAVKAMLPREVLVNIQKWIKVPSSNLLWVEGPAYTHFENQLSSTGAHICELASRAKIPCILFSPKKRGETQPETPILTAAQKRQSTLIDLLYSLAGQLIRLLAHEFESHLRLEELLGSLDEKFTSAGTALDLIETLLEHAPPIFLVILDKLQLADSQETRPYLTRLVTSLRGQGRAQITKTLFTTVGRCAALAETTSKGERVDAGRMVQGKPGQPLRGWSSVDDLKFQ